MINLIEFFFLTKTILKILYGGMNWTLGVERKKLENILFEKRIEMNLIKCNIFTFMKILFVFLYGLFEIL